MSSGFCLSVRGLGWLDYPKNLVFPECSPRAIDESGSIWSAAPHERPRSCANKPDSFAHVARTPEEIEEEVDDSQGREQDLSSGRCGTRTHDLSRVKAAL